MNHQRSSHGDPNTHTSIVSAPRTLAFVVALALAFSTSAAMATSEPIPGVDIIVKCNGCKPPRLPWQVSSNGNGEITLQNLVPGEYIITLDGKSLRRAINRIDRNPEGPAHIIGVRIGARLPAGQKTIFSSEQRVGRGAAGPDVRVGFTIPADMTGDGATRSAASGSGPAMKEHHYIGTVTLVR